jgi:phosphatidylinositol alpha-1,6-mannosyltransferase
LGLGVEERCIALISPGVDPRTFKPEDADPVGLDGKLVLLTLGRLQQRKGHDKVIEALPRVLREVPHLVYGIAGVGEEETALRNLAAEGGERGRPVPGSGPPRRVSPDSTILRTQ